MMMGKVDKRVDTQLTLKEITYGQYLKILEIEKEGMLATTPGLAKVAAVLFSEEDVAEMGGGRVAVERAGEVVIELAKAKTLERDKSFKYVEIENEKYYLPTLVELGKIHWTSNANLEQFTLAMNEIEAAKSVNSNFLKGMAYLLRKRIKYVEDGVTKERSEYVTDELLVQRTELFKKVSVWDAYQCFFLVTIWSINLNKRLNATSMALQLGDSLKNFLLNKNQNKKQDKSE